MGNVIVPLTALPVLFWRVSVTLVIGEWCLVIGYWGLVIGCFAFVSIIYADDSAGEDSDLSEGYKDSLVYLSLRCEQSAEVKQAYSG